MALELPTGRNLVILPSERAARRGAAGLSLDPCWPSKDPAEVGIYAADFAWVFDGQTLMSVSAAVTPDNAVTILTQQLVGTAYVIEVAGGSDGVAATILLTATCGDGRVALRPILLPVEGDGVAPPSGSAPVVAIPVTTFLQSVPAAVWTIQHNLDRYPLVLVIDAAGDQVEMDVRYVDTNTLTLTAAGALSGAAYLS